MAPPRISVLLPVYNGAPYVAAAVESMLGQTFADFELLILDDGSTDGSFDVLEPYRSADPRVRLVRRENKGLVATLNELVTLARGALLARMDADDVSLPNRLARQLAYLDASPATVAVGSRVMFIDPEGLPITGFIDHFSHEQIERALMRAELGIVHPSVMMRRADVMRVGGYREAHLHVEDLDLFLRLAEIGRLANLPEVLLRYRVHPASVSHRHTEAQAAAGRRAVAAAHDRRAAAGQPLPAVRSARASAAESKADLHRKWSWWALAAGNLRTARKHALRALAEEPSNRLNVKLMLCVARDTLLRHRPRAAG